MTETNGLQETLEAREQRLLLYQGEDRVVTLQEYMEKNPPLDSYGLKTGLPMLDQATDGFHTGEVIVISGPTKQGKTLLCETISQNISSSRDAYETAPLWFSYEVPMNEFIKHYSKIPNFRVPLSLTSKKTNWIEERVLEAKMKHRCQVVFIDHLHFLADIMISKNISHDVGQVMRYLKQNIAIQHDVAVFVVAHINKSKLSGHDELTVSDIKDSSFIPQEADTTWMVRRLRGFKDAAEITVCNHRRTGVWEEKITVAKEGSKLVERNFTTEEHLDGIRKPFERRKFNLSMGDDA